MPAIVRVGGPGASQPFVRIPPADGTRSTSTSSSTIISVEYPASVSTTASSGASAQDCRCGATYIPGAKFCSECGAKVALCSCGTAFAPGAKFCSECGAKRFIAATKDFRLSDESTESDSETISYGDITEVYAFDARNLPEAESAPSMACSDRRHLEQDVARVDKSIPQHRRGPSTKYVDREPEQAESRLDGHAFHEVRSEPRRKDKERRGARDGLQESHALSNLKQLERDLPISSAAEREPRRREKEKRGFEAASKEALTSPLDSFSQKINKQQSSPFPHSVHEALKRPEKNRSGTPVPTGKRASVLNVQPLDFTRQSGYPKAVDGAALSDLASGCRGKLATVPGGWDLGSLRTKKKPARI